MNLYRILRLFLLSILATGCAIGNQYDYRTANLPMSVKGDATIGVSATESRPYVINGDKEANFVGLQRGGFGNPFDVTTQSGNPLVEDMTESLLNSLVARGFNAVALDSPETASPQVIAHAAEKNGLLRIVVLDVREWKSDAMLQLTMHHDLVLSVYNSGGDLLAESRSSRIEPIGSASFQDANASAVRGEFERVVGGLFENPSVKHALQIKNN